MLWTSTFMRVYSALLQCANGVGQLRSEALCRNFRRCHNATPLISHYSFGDFSRSMASVTANSCPWHVQECSSILLNELSPSSGPHQQPAPLPSVSCGFSAKGSRSNLKSVNTLRADQTRSSLFWVCGIDKSPLLTIHCCHT